MMRGCVEKIRLSHQIDEVKRARSQSQPGLAKKRTVCLDQAALAHRFCGFSAELRGHGQCQGRPTGFDALRLRYRTRWLLQTCPGDGWCGGGGC